VVKSKSKEKSRPVKVLYVRTTEDLIEGLKEIAWNRKVSVNTLCCDVLSKFLNRAKAKKNKKKTDVLFDVHGDIESIEDVESFYTSFW